MGPTVDRLKQQVASLLAGFTAGQKAMVALAVAGLLAGGLGFSRWASQPSYSPLFTGLDATDAAAITEKLEAKKVSYELADGGRSVLVPRSDLYQLRLEMSAAGLPTGGTAGYSLLDKQGITTSEFRQRVDYQRAMEGELTKTVAAIEGVQGATVHLVIPKDDLFSDDQRHPSASVLVKTAAGKSLAPGQVQAVVHLVSSSVEGLEPDAVTVADAKGVVLSAPGQPGADLAAGDARTQQTAAFEQSLAQSVQELLAPVVGPGGAVVRVKAELDFDRRSTTTERYEPGAAPVSEATTKETFTGTGAPVGGVLGPDAMPVAGAAPSNYQKEETQRSNAVGRVTEQVEAAPGAVRRMSVAVLLDKRPGLAQQEVSDLVSAAVLLDRARGDEINVTTAAFDDTTAKQAAEELARAEAATRQASLLDLARTAGTALVVALVLLVAWRRSSRPRREAVGLPAGSAQAFVLRGGDEPQGALEAAGPAPEARELEPAARQRLAIQSEIAELVDRQPDEVAQLLRGWLADRRS